MLYIIIIIIIGISLAKLNAYFIDLIMFLNDVKAVTVQINQARTDRIKLLHKLIFKTDSGRLSRKELREFIGFDFKDGDNDFSIKLTGILDKFYQIQLISITNLLRLNIRGIEQDIAK